MGIEWTQARSQAGSGVRDLIGFGRSDAYLVARTRDGRVVLARWPEDAATHTEALRDAVASALPVSDAERAQEIAAKYEAGLDIPQCPGWQHGYAPGAS